MKENGPKNRPKTTQKQAKNDQKRPKRGWKKDPANHPSAPNKSSSQTATYDGNKRITAWCHQTTPLSKPETPGTSCHHPSNLTAGILSPVRSVPGTTTPRSLPCNQSWLGQGHQIYSTMPLRASKLSNDLLRASQPLNVEPQAQ